MLLSVTGSALQIGGAATSWWWPLGALVLVCVGTLGLFRAWRGRTAVGARAAESGRDSADPAAGASPGAGSEASSGGGSSPAADREARRHLSFILEHAPIALWTVDRDLRFTSVRGLGITALGIQEEDLLGMTVAELFETDDPEFHALVANRRALEGESASFEVEWGGRLWDCRLAPIEEEGRITGVVGAALDVTKRREIERRLEEQSAHFRKLFEAAPEAIVLVDAEDRVLQANPEFERLFGYSPAEAEGRRVNDLIVPADGAREAEELTRRVAGGARIEVEAVRQRKDGTRVQVSILATPVDVGGDRRVYGIYRDITEQKRLETQLLHSQRLEAVGQLAGGVAHDFNNILTAILGHTRVLIDELGRDVRVREDLEQIEDAAQRAARLTRQLLTFGRRDMASLGPVDMNRVIREMRALLTRLIEERVELAFELAETLPAVEADTSQFEQIVLNLVLNARDAMPDGGHIRVRTEWVGQDRDPPAFCRHQGWVALEVEDQGCGMSAEEKARMFEPFFTTKGPGKSTGLGLSTVYGIVERMGGFIHVDSEPGRGTSLRICFPPAGESAAARSATEQSDEPVPAGHGELLLLVDDDRPVREVTRRILEREGYRVMTAESGPAALELLDETDARPDLVLTDIVMPGMTGHQLVDALRERYPDIRYLLMSGYTESQRAGAPDHKEETAEILLKPFDVRTLARRVRERLSAHTNPRSAP